jgi:hypothetical protein
MARIGAPAYLNGVIKDAILLIVGVALAALSWPMLAHGHLLIGRNDSAASIGAAVLFVGLALIVLAIADWRYRRGNA